MQLMPTVCFPGFPYLDKKMTLIIPIVCEEVYERIIGEYSIMVYDEDDEEYALKIEHLDIEPI